MAQVQETETGVFMPADHAEPAVNTICSRAFKRGEHRIRHERRHTQEKPYLCKLCDNRYVQKDLLLRHQRLLHGAATSGSGAKKAAAVAAAAAADIDTASMHSLQSSSATQVLVESHESLDSVHATLTDDTSSRDSSGMLQHHVEHLKLFNSVEAESPLFTDPFFEWPSQQMADLALPHLSSHFVDSLLPLKEYSNLLTGGHDPLIGSAPDIASVRPNQQHFAQQSNPVSLRVNLSVFETNRHQKPIFPIRFTNETRERILRGVSAQVSPELLELLASVATILYERCLQRYFATFNTHAPLFHLPSLDVDKVPAAQLLSMCATGALYRMERKVAAIFYNAARQSLENISSESSDQKDPLHELHLQDWIKPTSTESESPIPPLWISQSRLLLTLFETFSGDSKLSSMAIYRLGFFVWDFRARLNWLQSHTAGQEELSWETWVERESVKRLLYGYMYLCNLISMLLDIASGFSMLTDGTLEMPCHHSLWDSANADSWRENAKAWGLGSPLRLKDAVTRLLDETTPHEIPAEYWEWDPYSCHVAVNAVSIYISHMTQGLYFLDESSQHAAADRYRVSDITSQMVTAITKCLHLIKGARARADESHAWEDTEGPLLFNSLAILRVSYCRIMTRAESAARGMLFRMNEAEMDHAIRHFLSETMEWTQSLNRAVSVALEGILIPTRIGSGLVRKTAAFAWAIEHALAGWDAILLLSKWLHAKESLQRRGITLDKVDMQIIQRVRDMLAEDSEPNDSSVSLAAALTRSWAGFYDDTWVWGVTPKMGRILRQLANHYEDAAA
ncbi:uncharacterized protein L3040_004007 [Drepanopeziza brunnea f. sp. 'multigermtubi']|uniref:C2H2-type domain-containing protein n=1 Tax=Marssonina brunnea f. sp. multigermtubi (strain MB_m1) TaxID=1072389 RepID=K1X1T7_MARBU|nr:uncharacterized protein MBM_06984 [Drepanopeziza brunnea f. sp. 'multigermtubi' MB_m1]EKD14773.1 hypothetical protein MBM_06984 [Drepanopeziza brunnea f. sp. 'multigermtubi' MB_m1]KAJ5046780.1 hypothetical protein L3040_004007 [Drepanopeziza brunnea f. sp. 'multigermtubi']